MNVFKPHAPRARQLSLWILPLMVCCAGPLASASTKAPQSATQAPLGTDKTAQPANWKQHAAMPHAAIWIKQDFAAAKARAAKENKPLFVFWSVSWCPYCAELKNQVFANKDFPKLMKNFVPVFLDGDLDGAQQLGESLQISAYPTTLVLAPDGKELFRITETITYDTLKQVLSKVQPGSFALTDRLAKAESGAATDEDWKLFAAASWDLVPESVLSPEDNLRKRAKLLPSFPEKLGDERAQFAGALLMSLAEGDGDAVKAVTKEYPSLVKDLATLLLTPGHEQAKRVALAHTADETWPLVVANGTPEETKSRQSQWLAALKVLQTTKTTPHETQLFVPYASAIVSAVDGKLESISTQEKASAVTGIQAAYKKAGNAFERHTLLMDAAYTLRQLGAHDDARKDLLASVKGSETPWYLYSSLANVEKSAGNKSKALEYADAARTSAKGDATRIQWLVSDIVMKVKLQDKTTNVAPVLKEYYEVAFGLPDGFATRNAARAKSLAKEISSIKDDAVIKPIVTEYDALCQKNVASGDKSCLTHFSALNAEAAKPIN